MKSSRWIGIVLLLWSVTAGASALRLPDSTVVFRFKVGKDMFWADYSTNQKELERMEVFLAGNRAQIRRGEKQITVNGYASSKPTETENLALARLRSNRVKSYLILMYSFREGFFTTTNHPQSLAGVGDVVTVSFLVPRRPIDPDSALRAVAPPALVPSSYPTTAHIEPQRTVASVVIPGRGAQVQTETPLPEALTYENPQNWALLGKGAYFVGASGNFTNVTLANMLIEPLFDVHNLYSMGVDVQLIGGYFLDDNLAVGLYGGYKMSELKIDVSSDLLQLLVNAKNYQTNNITTGYNLGAFMRNYMPVEYKQRIFLVTETSLYFSQSQSLQRNVYDRGAMLSKVWQDTWMLGIRASFGVQYFVYPGFSLDFMISPVAVYYTENRVLNNEVLAGKFSGGQVGTLLMPLDLRFGFSYTFGLDYRKNNRYTRYVENNTLR